MLVGGSCEYIDRVLLIALTACGHAWNTDKAGCFAKIMEHGAWGVLFETRHTPRHEPQLVQTSQRSEDAMNHAFPYSMRVILPRYPIIAVRPVPCATNWKTTQRPTRHAPCRVLTVWETSGLSSLITVHGLNVTQRWSSTRMAGRYIARQRLRSHGPPTAYQVNGWTRSSSATSQPR